MTTSMRRFVADDPVEVLQHPHGEAARAGDENQLKNYWLHGEGRAKWETWTELYNHLKKHMANEMAKRVASEWFEERHGYAAGSDKNRVAHGKPPRGERVGPG